MRRADRLFQIVQLLRGGRLLTAASLADRLEVSERTIYRDIADLSRSGVPIQGEAGVGYVLRGGFDIPPLMFTNDEVVALVVGARLVQAFGGAEMARHAEEALEKVRAVLPESARRRAAAVHIHPLSVAGPPDGRAHLDAIDAAIDACRRLQLTYCRASGVETTRVVRPLGLLYWAGAWTLVGWCELRHDFRTFRVDRIVALEPGRRFAPDPARSLAVALQAGHLRPVPQKPAAQSDGASGAARRSEAP